MNNDLEVKALQVLTEVMAKQNIDLIDEIIHPDFRHSDITITTWQDTRLWENGLTGRGGVEAFKERVKQLYEDPWNKIPQIYSRGTKVKGKVRKITDFGAFIEIEPGIDGLCHISEFSTEHIKNPRDFLSPDEKIDIVILDVNQEKRKISLSIKALNNLEKIDNTEKNETILNDSNLDTFGENFKTKLLDN